MSLLLRIVYCVMVIASATADMLYLPNTPEDVSALSVAKADVKTRTRVTQISTCMWMKSLHSNSVGSLFTINYKGSTTVAFGLVQLKEITQGSGLDTYVIVNNKLASKPVKLEVNDFRWHQVCVTWSNLEGKWRVFSDGQIIGDGNNLMTGEVLSGQLEINFGGLTSQIDILRFGGKITDAFVWSRPLSSAYVKKIYNCKKTFRSSISKNLQGESQSLNLYAWTGRADMFVWQPHKISYSGFVEVREDETLCNQNVVIECTPNSMVVSVLKSIVNALKVEAEDIHLNDETCRPQIRGRSNGSIVFEITDLNSCGNRRIVNSREVVYSNTVSNHPTLPYALIVGQIFKMNVQCRYPVDIRVTMASANKRTLVGKTDIAKTETLQAVSMLFKDDTYAQVHENAEISNTESKIYVGIALKDKIEVEFDLKMVAEKCWLSTKTKQIILFQNRGCLSGQQNAVKVFENGDRDQTRFELPSSLVPENTATYLHCAVSSCRGENCQKNCEANRNRRDISNVERPTSYSYVSIGPIYRNTTSTEEEKRAETESFPLYMIIIVGALVAIAATTCFVLLYCLCRRHRTINHGADSLNSQSRNGKMRPRSASIGSFGNFTLSSSFPSTLSIDLYGDDTSCSSVESSYYYYVNP